MSYKHNFSIKRELKETKKVKDLVKSLNRTVNILNAISDTESMNLDIHIEAVQDAKNILARLDKIKRKYTNNGIWLGSYIAEDFNKYVAHDYLLSDCILGKFNLLKGLKPRKNKNKIAFTAKQVVDILNNYESRQKEVMRMTKKFKMVDIEMCKLLTMQEFKLDKLTKNK